MASNVPTVRQISWGALLFQLALLGILIYVFELLDFGDAIITSAIAYWALAFGLRNLFAKPHRQGMKLVKSQKFIEALPLFEKSVAYFSKNRWIDKYRFIMLLSSSRLTYREMGLCNIAFCYSQTGNGLKAKEVYSRTLEEYPENGLANAGLNMLTSLEK